MKTTVSYPKRHLFIGSLLVLLFLIPLVAACSSYGGDTTTTPRSTAGRTGIGATTPEAAPGILLGVQPCPGATKNSAYWNPFIAKESGDYRVESVNCGNLLGSPSLQALVTVRHMDAGEELDVYVFTNITGATPKKVFQVMGLVKGEAKISGYNSVMTAQADELSALNIGKPVSAMTADLFREFKWSDGAGTLVQTVFPGIFPDLTRYQAEADQAAVNQGHQPWKLDAEMVARALAVSLLKWPTSSSTTLISGGGSHDVSAVVRVRSSYAVSGSIVVTLSRLEGNTNGGIWEATAVAADGVSIASPAPLTRLLSPVQVNGAGNAFEGVIGRVVVLDHLYNSIGQVQATGVSGNGHTTFSTSVSYQTTFPAGVQEGVMALYAPSNANGSIAAAVMVKVLIASQFSGNM